MTKLVILSETEQKRFDAPPKFTDEEQTLYFAINKDLFYLIESLRTPTNKVGFLLQLGYFRSHGKFYPAHQFRQQDIQFLLKLLGLEASNLDLSKYQKRIPILHREKILKELAWKPLTQKELDLLEEYVIWQAKNQHSPKQLFMMVVDYCWKNKLELPSYNQIALFITQAYNKNESTLVKIGSEYIPIAK